MRGFDEAVEFVLASEGGYGWDKHDPGGETNFGVTDRADGTVDGLVDINRDGVGDVSVKGMSRDQAKEVYREQYWKKLPPGLPDQLAAVVFDCAVNTGMSRTIRLLQKAVGVDDDGKWGPVSAAALHALGEKEAILRFCTHRINYYHALSTFETYGMGWTKRVIAGVMV